MTVIHSIWDEIRSNTLLNGFFLACLTDDRKRMMEILNKKRMLELIKIKDKNGRSLIHYCAECSNELCISSLIQTWPQLLFDQDNDGYTVLHLSIINGNQAMTKFLCLDLKHMINDSSFQKFLNRTDNEGHSPFHWATVCHEIECLEILSQSGALPCIPDIHGAHPLHYAAQMTSPYNSISKDTKTALAVLKKLLTFPKIDPDCKDRDQRTPLLWAASSGSSEAILLLIKAGAAINAREKDGLTALHCAASRGHLDCLETLTNLCGADIDLLDSFGCSSLFYAVTLGQADCTQFLLQNGAESNLQDIKGRTAAHCGAYKGQFETLKILANHGANLWIRNVRGDLPLHEAIKSGRKDLVRWLLQLYPNTVNISNSVGRTPLHIASMNNNLEMCKILIDSGAEINPVMKIRSHLLTPLDAALYKGYRNGAKFLLLHGALPANKLNLSHKSLNQKLTRGIRSETLSPSFYGPEVEAFQAQQSERREEIVVSNSDQNVDQKIENKKEEVVSMRELQAGNSESASSDYGIRSQSIVTNVYVNTLGREKETLLLEKKQKYGSEQGNTQSSKASQIDTSSTNHDYIQTSDEMSNQNSEMEVIVNGHEKGNVIVKRSIKPLKKLSKESKKNMADHKKIKKLSPLRHHEKRSAGLFKQLEPIQKQDINQLEENGNKIMTEKDKTMAERNFAVQREKKSKSKLNMITLKQSKAKEKTSDIKHNSKQVDTKSAKCDQIKVKQDIEKKIDENDQNQVVGKVDVEKEDEEIRKDKRDNEINHGGEDKLIEKSKSLNNLVSTSLSQENHTSKLGLTKLKYQDSIRSTQSSNSQAPSFGESVQSIQLSELGYSSLAYLSNDDQFNHKPIRTVSTMDLRTQTDENDPKILTFPKLVDTSKSKLKSDSKCGHRLHYKSNPSGMKAVDLSHVTAKVDTKGYQIHHKTPSHLRQKLQTSTAEDAEIFQKAEQEIHKYQTERKLFEELKQLKRYQVRTGRVEEPTMVKRLVDHFRKEIRTPGMGDFNDSYTYKAYEKFLYNELRKLSWSNQGKLLPFIKAASKDDIALDYIKKLESGNLNKAIQRSKKGSLSAMSGFDPFLSKDDNALNQNLPSLATHSHLSELKDQNHANSVEMLSSLKEDADFIFPIFGAIQNPNRIETKVWKSKNLLPKLKLGKRLETNEMSEKREAANKEEHQLIKLNDEEAAQCSAGRTTAKYEQYKKLNQTQRRVCLKQEMITVPLDSARRRPKFKRSKTSIPLKHQLDIPIKEIEQRWRLIKAESKKKLKLTNSNPEINTSNGEFDLIYEINIPREHNLDNTSTDSEGWMPMTIYRVESEPLILYRHLPF